MSAIKPYMAVIFVDSYSDKLLKELTLEDIDPNNPDGFKPIDYFTPCPNCELPVLDSSIVPEADGECDHCVVNQPEREDVMKAVFVDSWGDKLEVNLNCETHSFAADYFRPCDKCGNSVLACNFSRDSEICHNCELEITNPTPTTKIQSNVGKGPKQSDIDKLLLINQLPEDKITLHDSIESAVYDAREVFWNTIAKNFPECKAGDLEPLVQLHFEKVLIDTITTWVNNNMPVKQSYRGEKNKLHSLHLHYEETWHSWQSGGRTELAITDNVEAKDKYYYLVVSTEAANIYEDTFKENDWMMNCVACWIFGDNQTVLMNYLDEFMSYKFDSSILFDDIITLAKSKPYCKPTFPAAGDTAAALRRCKMRTYKQAINVFTDDELVTALSIYHGCPLDLKDPEWRTTVLDYVRRDYALEVDPDDYSVSVKGDEHMNYFGEFLLFNFCIITVAKQDSGIAFTWPQVDFNFFEFQQEATEVAPNVYYNNGDTFVIKCA